MQFDAVLNLDESFVLNVYFLAVCKGLEWLSR